MEEVNKGVSERSTVRRMPERARYERNGIDEEEDYLLDTWAGVIPLGIDVGRPLPDPRLVLGIPTPEHITDWRR